MKPTKANDMKLETFSFDVDADGIALATFDVPGRSMNTLTAKAIAGSCDHRAGSGHQRDDQGPRDHIRQDQRVLRWRGPRRAWRRIGRRRQGGDPEAGLKAAFERSFGMNKILRNAGDLQEAGRRGDQRPRARRRARSNAGLPLSHRGE
jgi:hypothetical protein